MKMKMKYGVRIQFNDSFLPDKVMVYDSEKWARELFVNIAEQICSKELLLTKPFFAIDGTDETLIINLLNVACISVEKAESEGN